MSDEETRSRRVRWALTLLVFSILAVRLVTLGTYPLMDTTEARYGEIARVMLTTGNYVTPQEIPGIPFWAKPPLYAWMSAISIRLLGVSEFALRLPSFLCALGILALSFFWTRSLSTGSGSGARRDAESGIAPWLAVAFLSTSVLFFVSAGAVMTDPSLQLCITAMWLAFHQAVIRGDGISERGRRFWGYAFFVAAGFGMLAKGPVILMYVGGPIALWAVWQRRIAHAWKAMPWISGMILGLAICVPWYALAEDRTPGYLQYFLIGEHILRFLKPGWKGDLYGTAHVEPMGTIWAELAGSLGVASLLAVAVAIAAIRARAKQPAQGQGSAAARVDGAHAFLLLCAVFPVAFFTFAANIIWTYVLHSLVPIAVLLADWCAPAMNRSAMWRRSVWATLAAAWLVLVAAIVSWVPHHVARHSAAELVARWRAQDRTEPGPLRYWGPKAPASLRFYSRGAAAPETNLASALQGADGSHAVYLVTAPSERSQVEQAARSMPGRPNVRRLGANVDMALWEVGR